ncbi:MULTISPECIES: IclR family transcriptional regulator [Halomonadaceae]|uniref:IclR family transcriptional regulator n=1 Tax=Halomonadaceae TaxID=28256 RepID=UPI001597D306|nr:MULTISPECIES: IclR family transcriptional regulator C-terminal domain-containing protein [unclassified Halomonas]QJQ95551.1 helix-turn-helix domain-containing protein [Halomonas sp. PA5]
MTESKRKPVGRPAGASKSSGGHSQSLVRGLNILEGLAAAPMGLALSDIAQIVGLAPSTTHRLLQALHKQGFITQDSELGLWKIGVKTFQIGNTFLEARDFVATARPYLRQLTNESGESTNLGIRDDGWAVFLAQSESPQMMRMITRLGSRAPLHASGVGKALLAWLPDTEIERILQARGLPRVTDNTIDTPSRLREGLAEIRRQGYACDREEHAVGLHCVAASIHDEQTLPIGAISVSGPMARIPESRLTELGGLVSRAAQEITLLIGGRLPTSMQAQEEIARRA